MSNPPHILPDPIFFLRRLFEQLEVYEGQLNHLEFDHICYRVETLGRYEELKACLAERGTLLVEGEIGGRPIATYRLHEPFLFRGRAIEVIELPAPKPDRPYPEGYEHVEFITDRPLEAFAKYLIDVKITTPEGIDRSGMSKARNRDLRIPVPPVGNVKFHERSLADVIKEELLANQTRK